jgi:hypothetical protein
MRLRLSSLILGCAALALAGGLANAQPRIQPAPGGGGGGGGQQQASPAGLITKITAEQTAEIMTKAGYTDVKIINGNQGTRHVGGKAGETPVFAIHAGCENGACSTVTFTVYFGKQESIDLNYMNAWHTAWRFTKLYRDKDNDIVFDMDVPLLTGVTPDYFTSASILFVNMLKKVMEFKPS